MVEIIDFENELNIVRKVFKFYPQRFKENEEELKKLRREELDLLHLIEQVNFHMHESWIYYKQLQKILQRRRILKEENELLNAINSKFSSSQINSHDIDEVIGITRKITKRQNKRNYFMKERKDLQSVIDKRGNSHYQDRRKELAN